MRSIWPNSLRFVRFSYTAKRLAIQADALDSADKVGPGHGLPSEPVRVGSDGEAESWF